MINEHMQTVHLDEMRQNDLETANHSTLRRRINVYESLQAQTKMQIHVIASRGTIDSR